jgi:anti-anti-sigma factor
VGTPVAPDVAWVLRAQPAAVAQLRHLTAGFALAAGVTEEVVDAIRLAVSEAVTNLVRHAYDGEPGEVRVSCRLEGGQVIITVADDGVGITRRRGTAGSGHGLSLVGAVAQALEVTAAGERGTVVSMSFGSEVARESPPGLEGLCALAVSTIADASCVDIVVSGVLRRAAAEVAGDPALTAWLRSAVPPAKPGTATWAALHQGGVQLVLHDPTVARSVGGTGETLSLLWWVAVPVRTPAGELVALWGLGGREGGRRAPSSGVLHMLEQAASSDLSQATTQQALRARLEALRKDGAADGRSGTLVSSRQVSDTMRPSGMRSGEFSVRISERGSSVVVAPHGELDIATAQQLRAELERQDPARTLVLDLRGLAFMDSSGLALILEQQRRAERHGSEFLLIQGSETLKHLFEATGAESLLKWVAAEPPPSDPAPPSERP